MRYEELTIEGRNAVLEAFRAGKPIDRLFILDGCQDGPDVYKRQKKKEMRPRRQASARGKARRAAPL